MRVKDGSPLNAVRADFKSIDEVKTLIRSGKINIGSMIHPVKPYHLPIRVNKCLKCLRHDHTTSSCIRPRLCPRCAEEHSLEHGCPNKEKCINCEGEHVSGHSACPIVQEKRRALLDKSKKQRAELLVLAERQQNRYEYHQNDYPTLNNNNLHPPASQSPRRTTESSQKSYAQSIKEQRNQGPQLNIEYTLSSFLNKMERRLEEFSFRLSSQLCEIEKKLNVYSDQQNKLERIVHEIILPSIQVLGRTTLHSPKKRNNQDELKKLNNEINDILIKKKHQADYYSHQLSPNRIDSSLENVSR
jgi:hypothetical protein